MNKIKIPLLIISIIMFSSVTVRAMTLDEAIQSTLYSNHPEYVHTVSDVLNGRIESAVHSNILKSTSGHPEYADPKDIEYFYEYFNSAYTLVPDRSFVLYTTDMPRYAKQYAEENAFEYLISEPLIAIHTKSEWSGVFDSNGTEVNMYSGIIQDSKCSENLKKFSDIQVRLDTVNAGDILDCKILEILNWETALYLNCENGKYIIALGERDEQYPESSIEPMKLYSVSEYIDILAEYGVQRHDLNADDMLDTKPTYDAEAQSLQKDGLLQGNENGLDLLKPLTRAEAVTLLIRALGFESEAVKYTTSAFTDIPSDNWASPYAALAKDKGIAAGISETEFAPNEPVTADQFAAFTLRAMGDSNFDYTQGIEMLIDRGIITTDEAETMDLFTRGDMAKIVYEAREKGLL